MELFSTRLRWNRCLAAVRIVLPAAAIAGSYLRHDPHEPAWYAVVALYLVYAVAVMFRGAAASGIFGLLTLFGDTVFFLALVATQSHGATWASSILFLFLMAEATGFYGPVEVLILTAVSVGFCAFATAAPVHTVVVGGALGCGYAFHRRRMEARTRVLQQQLDEARDAAEKAREVERTRIASDFHDGPLQSFISLQMRLEILRKLLERDFNAGLNDLRQLQDLAQSQVRELRAFLRSMRPLEVDANNFFASARRAAETFQKESGIPVTFVSSDARVSLPQEVISEVLQMLREALHNVQKHAKATRVAVAVEKHDRAVEISVDDNGHGFPFAGSYSLEELELLRLGPVSLKRRARSLNADFVLESRPGRGVGLKFSVPIP